jgi:hypothetical protein
MKSRNRWFIATIAGAIMMFVWGAISHLVLLEGIGFTRMTNEEQIVAILRDSLSGNGLYFFPSIDLRGTPSVRRGRSGQRSFALVPPE